MARIPTQVQRRLSRLRKRQVRRQVEPSVVRSSTPFRYDACLRLAGLGPVQEDIEQVTGVAPSHRHRKGDAIGRSGRQRKEDLWLLASPLGEEASLDEHLGWLWLQVEEHGEAFRRYIQQASWADVCLGCLSESVYPVLTISPQSLRILRELDLALTFNFTVV